MPIPFCHMIPMPVVKSTLKINILKMEQAFHGGYREGDKVFYVSLTNQQGGVESTSNYELEWNSQWKFENDRFEEFLNPNLDLQKLSHKMFFVWDGNRCLQAWLPYIDQVHLNDSIWHISVDSMVLDTIDGLVVLLTVMTYLNK